MDSSRKMKRRRRVSETHEERLMKERRTRLLENIKTIEGKISSSKVHIRAISMEGTSYTKCDASSFQSVTKRFIDVLNDVDTERFHSSRKKHFLNNVHPVRLEQLESYFSNNIQRIRKQYKEDPRGEFLNRLEIASNTWLAIIEAVPSIGPVLADLKCTFDKKLLSYVIEIEKATLNGVHSELAKKLKNTQGGASMEQKIIPMAEPKLQKCASPKRPVGIGRTPESKLSSGRKIVLSSNKETFAPGLYLDQKVVPRPIVNWLQHVIELLEGLNGQAQSESTPFEKIYTVLGSCMHAVCHNVSRTNHQLGDVLLNLWSLLLGLFCEVSTIRENGLRKQQLDVQRELETQVGIEEEITSVNTERQGVLDGDCQMLQYAILNLREAQRKTRANLDYQRMKLSLLKKDIDLNIAQERKMHQKSLSLENRRIARNICAKSLKLNACKGVREKRKLQEAIKQAFLKHRDLEKRVGDFIFRETYGDTDESENIREQERKLQAQLELDKKNQEELERVERARKDVLLVNTSFSLQRSLGILKTMIGTMHDEATTSRNRDACVQADFPAFGIQKNADSTQQKKWSYVEKSKMWQLRLNATVNRSIPTQFIPLTKSVPEDYKPKNLSAKYIQETISQGIIYLQQNRSAFTGTGASSNPLDAFKWQIHSFFLSRKTSPEVAEANLFDFIIALREAILEEECGMLVETFAHFLGLRASSGGAGSRNQSRGQSRNQSRNQSRSQMRPMSRSSSSSHATFALAWDNLSVGTQTSGEDGGSVKIDKNCMLFFLDAYYFVAGCNEENNYSPVNFIQEKATGEYFILESKFRESTDNVFHMFTEEERRKVVGNIVGNNIMIEQLNAKRFLNVPPDAVGSLVDIIAVAPALVQSLKAWNVVKEATLERLKALFVAGDLKDQKILPYEQFEDILLAARPTITKQQASMMFSNALMAGTNSETVQQNDFVQVAFSENVLCPSEWEKGSIGLAKYAVDDQIRTKNEMSLFALKAKWTSMKKEIISQVLTIGRKDGALLESSPHYWRQCHFEALLGSCDGSGPWDQLDPLIVLEAAWFSFWHLRYEIDKAERSQHTASTMNSVQFLIRWKIKLRKQIKEQKQKSILVEHPMFSRTRWHRSNDFYKYLDGDDENLPFPINSVDSNGNSLLHIATQNEHIDYVSELLDRGIDIDIQNRMGQTAMHYAKLYDLKRIFFLMRRAGGNDKIKNNDGLTCYEMEEKEIPAKETVK